MNADVGEAFPKGTQMEEYYTMFEEVVFADV